MMMLMKTETGSGMTKIVMDTTLTNLGRPSLLSTTSKLLLLHQYSNIKLSNGSEKQIRKTTSTRDLKIFSIELGIMLLKHKQTEAWSTMMDGRGVITSKSSLEQNADIGLSIHSLVNLSGMTLNVMILVLSGKLYGSLLVMVSIPSRAELVPSGNVVTLKK
jgi:hypothetical protein